MMFVVMWSMSIQDICFPILLLKMSMMRRRSALSGQRKLEHKCYTCKYLRIKKKKFFIRNLFKSLLWSFEISVHDFEQLRGTIPPISDVEHCKYIWKNKNFSANANDVFRLYSCKSQTVVKKSNLISATRILPVCVLHTNCHQE